MKHRVEGDGVRITETKGDGVTRSWWLVPLLAVVIGGASAMVMLRSSGDQPKADAPQTTAATRTVIAKPRTAADGAMSANSPTRGNHSDPTASPPSAPRVASSPSASRPANQQPGTASPNEQSEIEDIARGMIEAAAAASGKREGLAAFPPPGTNPIKLGVVVPDDYQLPEGYMRYYQITDDGRRLEPILMFSPDYDFVDAQGNPVQLPADGIVPPEMAPPGLPIRRLEMPEHPYGGGLGSR